MTAPTLSQKKFYIIKPATGRNYLKKPTFAEPDGAKWWSVSGTGVTKAITGDEQRFGAYSMQVNTASGVASTAYYNNVTVTNGTTYTFSCYVKGTAGQVMLLRILDSVWTVKATTTFTATGYWQRQEVTLTAAETATTYKVQVYRGAVASTDPFYVDGVQFEPTSVATTLMEGYMAGCRWEGIANDSTTYRTGERGLGGEIIDLEDYCHIVQVTGLGHGDWNQILTKMTSGGDMYQTHIRKSRNFSIVVDFLGSSLGEIETNRAAVIDLIRPDLLPGQERIVRYQGVDENGVEATNPVDIVCVPLPATLTDTPDLPSYQRAVLNFTIPSGLLQGAYNEGAELDWIADFPAEHIVKRDPNGNWCKWNGSAYESLITGLNNAVNCMAEGPDGKIYVGGNFTDAGGVTAADRLARWNPVTEEWEAVVSGINNVVSSMAFDANGDLYIGGFFTDLGSTNGDRIVKITDLNGTPTVNALGTGANQNVYSVAMAPNGNVYIGGLFTLAGGVSGTARVARWDGTSWSALATGITSGIVYSIAFAPNGDLYLGGSFDDADYPCLCKWNGTAFSAVGTKTDIGNGAINKVEFDATGNLYIGGSFTNAGGVANADYIAKWSGSRWESLGVGTNGWVYDMYADLGKLYVFGDFTTAGGLTLTDRVAVWSNGAWQPLDIDLPGTAGVYEILPASDGSLYIGGAFSTAGETPDENAECGIVSDRVYEIGIASASANTYPFMQVHGPGTLKSIANHSTGKSIWFNGLTLLAGEYINLWFDPLNLRFVGGWKGRGNLMRYVVPGSDYGDFYLKPGNNLLSLFMTDSTSDTHAWIQWTPLFWGLDGALL